MKKFTKLLVYIMEKENELTKQIVEQASHQDPHAILSNAAHDAIQEVFEFAMQIILEDRIKQEKPKLKLITNR